METLAKLSLSDQELQHFLSGQDISIFSTPRWNEVLQKGFNARAWYYCLKEENQIFLCLPGILFDFKFVKVFHANVPYGEFIGDVNYIQRFLSLLEDHLKREKIHLIRIAHLENQPSRFTKGYQPRKGYQHVLDLDGIEPETLWKKYKSSIRRNILKADKSGVVVKEIEAKEELNEFYRLYLETMRRNYATPVWTKEIFDAIYDLLVISGQASILFAQWKGKMTAGIILIHSKDVVFYFLGASGKGFHPLRPNDALFHKAILKSLGQGKRRFDFMTCSEDDEELIRFKEKWGAERSPFIIYEKELDPFRARIWRGLWKIANSRVASYFLGSTLFSHLR